ncbi:MAG TPA: PEP-CTERM sorting domain-containing protein [Fimbriimonas sp.]|nr:PEP-CTERM sorting domain-containing protein [Fimbriimonas sp.]
MKKLLITALATGMSVISLAQTVNLTTFADDGYTQNFDSLSITASNIALTANGGEFNNGAGATLPGWYYGNANNAGYNLFASDGGSNTGRYYSFGTMTPSVSSDRALGTVSSGTPGTMNTGVRFTNGTGTSTGLFVVQFDLEQWRQGGNTASHGLQLSYKLVKGGGGFVQADFNTGTGYTTAGIKTQTTTTDDTGLVNLSGETTNTTIMGPIVGANTTPNTLDGNLVANSVRVRTVIQLFALGQSFDPSDEIIFRWSDVNDTGNDHGFGIDNVEAVPEPASMIAMGLGLAGLVARRRRASK